MKWHSFLALLLLIVASSAPAADLPGIPEFINEMVAKHQFDRGELERILNRAQHRQAVIDLITKPATQKPWPEYRANFLNDKRINGGLQFWTLHADSLQRAEEQYGVPQEIIVALIGVETMYGNINGRYSVLDALVTLAFDYPRRAVFFRDELEQYLLLAHEQKHDLFKMQGSYAGAIGIPQFMPSSYRKYAVDFSKDGKTDLVNDPIDAIGSVANYLKQYGWLDNDLVAALVHARNGVDAFEFAPGQRTVADWEAMGAPSVIQVEPNKAARLMTFTQADGKEYWLAFNNFDVITRYNNSDYYAMTVYQLAEVLREMHAASTRK